VMSEYTAAANMFATATREGREKETLATEEYRQYNDRKLARAVFSKWLSISESRIVGVRM
jgi:hypothetical protein